MRMPAPIRQWLSNPAGKFADQVLRGIAQVMLQNNPVTGLLFLLGIFINSWVSGLYALLGTVVATGAALIFGAPREDVDRGLYGLDGTLVALAFAAYLRHDPLLPAYVIIAAAFSSVVVAAIQDIFGATGHALTGPFVLTAWIFIGAIFTLTHLHGTPALGIPHLLTGTGPLATTLSLAGVGTATLNGVAQVMLQQNIWTGAIFLIAIAVNSRISCVAAALGSAFAAGIAFWFGAAPDAIRMGLYGFNAVLTAIALGGLFFLVRGTTVLLTALAVCVSTIFFGMLSVTLSPLGLPVLTSAFVFTTWLCLLARRALARLNELSPANPATPEGNLKAARRAEEEREQSHG